jgi:hypothetical protein
MGKGKKPAAQRPFPLISSGFISASFSQVTSLGRLQSNTFLGRLFPPDIMTHIGRWSSGLTLIEQIHLPFHHSGFALSSA